jgi:hypothetical protein
MRVISIAVLIADLLAIAAYSSIVCPAAATLSTYADGHERRSSGSLGGDVSLHPSCIPSDLFARRELSG